MNVCFIAAQESISELSVRQGAEGFGRVTAGRVADQTLRLYLRERLIPLAP